MNINKKITLHLSLIEDIGPAHIQKIRSYVEEQGQDLEAVYSYSNFDFRRMGFSELASETLCNGLHSTFLLDRELELIEKHAITVLADYEPEYPALLKSIHLPPAIMYLQGTFTEMPYLAIVGARNGDRYGYDVVQSLVPGLVASGVGIVSGGAVGIDTFAHEAALAAGGITAVILGGGLLRPYPARNKELFAEVVQRGGVLMSSFPLQAEPLPGQFPARNRIIAGIAHATLVVQAAKKSGSLITAEYALQEGRSVCAVPGPVDNPLSAGCHALLGQGARLVGAVDDILDEFGIERVATTAEQVDEAQQTSLVGFVKKEVYKSEVKIKHSVVQEKKDKNCQDPLLKHCSKPIAITELSLLMGVSEDVVNSILFELQLEGKIQQDFAGLWQKV
jgi:DNA processing protein